MLDPMSRNGTPTRTRTPTPASSRGQGQERLLERSPAHFQVLEGHLRGDEGPHDGVGVGGEQDVAAGGAIHLVPSHAIDTSEVGPAGGLQREGHPAQSHPADHLPHRGVREHPPVVDHHDALRQRLDLLEVVAGHHDGHPGGVESAQRFPQHVPGVDVQTGSRLVEEHQ